MNQASKRQYDSAYRQLANGESALYVQETAGSYVDSEWIAGITTSTPITCYEDSPSTKDIEKGLASVNDSKILISAKAMALVTTLIGDKVVFDNYTMTVKQLDPVKSLEGIVVLHQLFCSKMA